MQIRYTIPEQRTLSNWSPQSLVTPSISGLNYTESIRAMLESGIYVVVGDNSRHDLRPSDPFHGFLSVPKVGPHGGPVPVDFGAVSEQRDGGGSVENLLTLLYVIFAGNAE